MKSVKLHFKSVQKVTAFPVSINLTARIAFPGTCFSIEGREGVRFFFEFPFKESELEVQLETEVNDCIIEFIDKVNEIEKDSLAFVVLRRSNQIEQHFDVVDNYNDRSADKLFSFDADVVWGGKELRGYQREDPITSVDRVETASEMQAYVFPGGTLPPYMMMKYRTIGFSPLKFVKSLLKFTLENNGLDEFPAVDIPVAARILGEFLSFPANLFRYTADRTVLPPHALIEKMIPHSRLNFRSDCEDSALNIIMDFKELLANPNLQDDQETKALQETARHYKIFMVLGEAFIMANGKREKIFHVYTMLKGDGKYPTLVLDGTAFADPLMLNVCKGNYNATVQDIEAYEEQYEFYRKLPKAEGGFRKLLNNPLSNTDSVLGFNNFYGVVTELWNDDNADPTQICYHPKAKAVPLYDFLLQEEVPLVPAKTENYEEELLQLQCSMPIPCWTKDVHNQYTGCVRIDPKQTGRFSTNAIPYFFIDEKEATTFFDKVAQMKNVTVSSFRYCFAHITFSRVLVQNFR